MKIAVLDVCVWLEEFQSGQPRFGVVLRDWLKQGLPEAEYTIIDVGVGEPLPEPSEYDGYLLGGSEQGVYDDPPWMEPLRAFLLNVRKENRPIFGICFGHQIMADTWGGKAEKSSAGNRVGTFAYKLGEKEFTAHAWHKDQVTVQPPQSQVIASAEYCPIAALAYDFPALSVQFHPEYTRDFLGDFIDRSRGHILDEPTSDRVVAELEAGDVAVDLMADEAADFFRKNISNALV